MVTYIWSHSFPSPTSSQIPPLYPSYFIFFSLLKIYKTKTNKAQEEKKENKIEQNKTKHGFCFVLANYSWARSLPGMWLIL